MATLPVSTPDDLALDYVSRDWAFGANSTVAMFQVPLPANVRSIRTGFFRNAAAAPTSTNLWVVFDAINDTDARARLNSSTGGRIHVAYDERRTSNFTADSAPQNMYILSDIGEGAGAEVVGCKITVEILADV